MPEVDTEAVPGNLLTEPHERGHGDLTEERKGEAEGEDGWPGVGGERGDHVDREQHEDEGQKGPGGKDGAELAEGQVGDHSREEVGDDRGKDVRSGSQPGMKFEDGEAPEKEDVPDFFRAR